jgi:hypothetical protein
VWGLASRSAQGAGAGAGAAVGVGVGGREAARERVLDDLREEEEGSSTVIPPPSHMALMEKPTAVRTNLAFDYPDRARGRAWRDGHRCVGAGNFVGIVREALAAG